MKGFSVVVLIVFGVLLFGRKDVSETPETTLQDTQIIEHPILPPEPVPAANVVKRVTSTCSTGTCSVQRGPSIVYRRVPVRRAPVQRTGPIRRLFGRR